MDVGNQQGPLLVGAPGGHLCLNGLSASVKVSDSINRQWAYPHPTPNGRPKVSSLQVEQKFDKRPERPIFLYFCVPWLSWLIMYYLKNKIQITRLLNHQTIGLFKRGRQKHRPKNKPKTNSYYVNTLYPMVLL